jgi:hypothetical protein
MYTLLLSTVLCFAAPVPQGQAQVSRPLQGSGTTLVFKRIVAADLDGSGSVDVAMVRDNQLDVVGDPATVGWATSTLGAVKDLAVMPGTDPLWRDTLVSVGANGIQEWSAFENVGPTGESAPVHPALISGTLWNGAKLVAVAAVPGEARPRIVGCMGNSRTIRTLQDLGQGYLDYELSFSPALDEDVKDVALVDYQGDGTPELTLLMATKARICNLPVQFLDPGPTQVTNVVTLTAPAGYTEACMTAGTYPATHADHGKQWLAVVCNSTGPQQYLTVIDYAGPHASILLLGQPATVAMVAGRWDDNDTPDLLLSNNSFNALWLLTNTNNTLSGAPTFDASNTNNPNKIVVTYPSQTTGVQSNQSTPALADIDNDGDLDVLHAVRSTSSLFVYWNGAKHEDDFRPTIGNEEPSALTAAPVINDCGWTSALGSKLSVTLPASWPSGATHLEVALFRKESIGSLTERVSAPSLRFPLPLSIPPGTTTYLVYPTLPSPTLSYPGEENPPSKKAKFENFYIVLVRAIGLNPTTGAVRYAFPGSFYGMETSAALPIPPAEESPNADWMHQLPSAGTPMQIYFNCCGCLMNGIGEQIGTITPLPDMPTPAEGPIVVTPPL